MFEVCALPAIGHARSCCGCALSCLSAGRSVSNVVLSKMPDGLWSNDEARKVFRPSKDKVLSSMEELIQNFMIVTEGPQMPPGEVYFEAENPKGWLGFYIVSKGGVSAFIQPFFLKRIPQAQVQGP